MKRSLALATAILVTLCSSASFAAPEVNVGKNGIAIQGYDAVAFFTDAKPAKGSETFSTEYEGATYYFSSAKNLEAFKSNPEKYVPQYGGYCAYGVAQGGKFPVQIDTWQIVDGRLFLNKDKGVQKLFNEDVQKFIQEADQRWPGLSND